MISETCATHRSCISYSARHNIVLFILSACLSVTLNARARYSRIDSDWLSVFLFVYQLDKIVLKVIPITSFLFFVITVCELCNC